ncbi:MAG: hypothetical protein U1A25_00985 [Candidatus Sungbacteria bacterium]|nr:hypothetical protein [Candidatus Sungbacteria bacterium]
MLVILRRSTQQNVVLDFADKNRIHTQFGIPEIDAVLAKHSCIVIQKRFSDPLPIEQNILDETGAERMYMLFFPEDTMISQVSDELHATGCVKYAASPPLRTYGGARPPSPRE